MTDFLQSDKGKDNGGLVGSEEMSRRKKSRPSVFDLCRSNIYVRSNVFSDRINSL